MARLYARDAQLNHIAQGLLERRPILGLIGGELQPGFQCCNSRVGEGRHIRGAQTMAVLGTWTSVTKSAVAAKTMLCNSKRRAGERNKRRRSEHWFQHVDFLHSEPASNRWRRERPRKLKF